MTFADEVKNAVTPRAALLVIGVLGLQLLFIASYVGALHKPKPTDVPFGLVAPRQISAQLLTELKDLPGGPLDPRTVADAATAREQILDRKIDGALIVNPRGTTDTVLVASGGGTSLATTLTKIITEVDRTQQRTVRAVDLALPPTRTSTGSRRSTWSSAGASAATSAPRSWRSARAPSPPTAGAR